MKKFLISLLILIVSGLGIFVLLTTKSTPPPIQVQEHTWRVEALATKYQTLSPTVTLYGRVESPRTTVLRAPPQSTQAEIVALKVLEGDEVKQGDLLIELDDQDSQLGLQQREADRMDTEAQIALEQQQQSHNVTALVHEEALLALAQKALTRVNTLKKQNVSSDSVVEEAQRALEQQQLTISNRRTLIAGHPHRLAQLQARLARQKALQQLSALEIQRSRVLAPFSGMIAKVSVSVGDRVRTGDALLTLYDNSALEVRAQIPNRYQDLMLSSLAKRQFLVAQTVVGDKILRFQLDRLSGQIDDNSGGINGLFQVREGLDRLRLGQFVTFHLQLPPQPNVVALPFEAIYGGNRIYKLHEERMKAVLIEHLGERVTSEGQSWLLVNSRDLKEGDWVITTQLPNAMEGLKVQVVHSK